MSRYNADERINAPEAQAYLAAFESYLFAHPVDRDDKFVKDLKDQSLHYMLYRLDVIIKR